MALTETNDGLWFQEDLYPDIACDFRVSGVLHRARAAPSRTNHSRAV
jgi:hypothetical protein